MVLMALPPADHLLIERDRGQFVPSRRRRMMANVRAERLLKIPAESCPELRILAAAAQTRVVSMAGIRLGSWESARAFKGIICVDVSEFESYMPSHGVGSLWGRRDRSAPQCRLLHGRTRLAHHHVQCRQPHRKIGERLERGISRRSPMSVLRAKGRD